MLFKRLNLDKVLVYYFVLLLYLGKPFAKLTIVPNSNFFIVNFLVVIFVGIYSLDLLNKSIAMKKINFRFVIYFMPLILGLFNILRLESYDFNNFKKLMGMLSLSLAILIFYERITINNILSDLIYKIQNYYYIPIFLLFLQTILGKSGTYGLIFWSNPFISQNIFDLKPQRIFVAIAFTYFFIVKNKNNVINFVILLNIALLISYSRIILLMFISIIFLYLILEKDFMKPVLATFLIFIFIFSGSVDYIGLFLNSNLIDQEGKEFISIVCAEHVEDGVKIDDVELKRLYSKRNVDYGEYPTLPRYFSASNLIEFIEIENIPNILINGKKNICLNYGEYLSLDSKYIQMCSEVENNFCKVKNNNPNLFTSEAQSAQLGGNLEFRLDLWRNLLQQIVKSPRNLLIGYGIEINLPEIAEPNKDYGNLWHAHSSLFSIIGFYGLIGVLLFIFIFIYIISSKSKLNHFNAIILLSLIILGITDGVIETPDLSIIFSFMFGTLKK